MPYERDLKSATRTLMEYRPGQTYMQVRAELEGWLDGREETPAEAVAIMTDPANQLLCETCGWTVGMVCPECSKGCGCETRCFGWRHGEWAPEKDPLEEDEDNACGECGGDHRLDGYEAGCICV